VIAVVITTAVAGSTRPAPAQDIVKAAAIIPPSDAAASAALR